MLSGDDGGVVARPLPYPLSRSPRERNAVDMPGCAAAVETV
jgi:hypothetical protein